MQTAKLVDLARRSYFHAERFFALARFASSEQASRDAPATEYGYEAQQKQQQSNTEQRIFTSTREQLVNEYEGLVYYDCTPSRSSLRSPEGSDECCKDRICEIAWEYRGYRNACYVT